MDVLDFRYEGRQYKEADLRRMVDLLLDLEWSGIDYTAPTRMGGLDGEPVPCCPACGGIHPEEGKGEFIRSALGHKKTCTLKELLPY